MRIYKLEFKGHTNKMQSPIISLYDLVDDIDLDDMLKCGILFYYNSSNSYLLSDVYINIDHININTSEGYFEYEKYFEYVKEFKRDSVIDGILE